MLSRGNAPELTVPGPNAADRPTVNIRLEVMVDEAGRPDMKTLKITGIAGVNDRLALEQWIESASFRPALRNGQPVPGLFKASLTARVVVRRM